MTINTQCRRLKIKKTVSESHGDAQKFPRTTCWNSESYSLTKCSHRRKQRLTPTTDRSLTADQFLWQTSLDINLAPESLIIGKQRSVEVGVVSARIYPCAHSYARCEAEGRRSGQGRRERDRGVGPYKAAAALCDADMGGNESIDALEMEPT